LKSSTSYILNSTFYDHFRWHRFPYFTYYLFCNWGYYISDGDESYDNYEYERHKNIAYQRYAPDDQRDTIIRSWINYHDG